jgi:hypothetical protein
MQLVGWVIFLFFSAGWIFGRLARRYPSSSFHKRAFIFAACHFVICTILAVMTFVMGRRTVMIFSIGSDESEPSYDCGFFWWHELTRRALIILDAPIAAIVRLHPCDGNYPGFVCIIICSAIWSLALGYIVSGLTNHWSQRRLARLVPLSRAAVIVPAWLSFLR